MKKISINIQTLMLTKSHNLGQKFKPLECRFLGSTWSFDSFTGEDATGIAAKASKTCLHRCK